jgi:predicted NBD/HSP70 family sugar kinase
MGSFVPSDLKQKNRATVYSLLKTRRGLSKAVIARESGISPPTVQKIVEYFVGLGLVRENGEADDAGEAGAQNIAALGRRPRPLRLDPRAAYAIGAEYDGVHLSLGVVDLAGELHSLVRRKAPPEALTVIAELIEAAALEALASAGIDRRSVVGLGLGLPGTIDPRGRTLRFAPLVGITEPVDFGPRLDELEARLGFPLVLENDANAAALGEYAARSLGSEGDLLFVVLGRGIGAGLVLGGKLRKGPRSFAGEIGYLVFDASWKATLGAPGWLEENTDLASFWTEAEGASGPSRAALERVADHIALALADICIALDLERVVVGRAQRESFGGELLGLIGERLSRLSVLEVSCEAPVAQEPGVSGAASLALDLWLQGVYAG